MSSVDTSPTMRWGIPASLLGEDVEGQRGPDQQHANHGPAKLLSIPLGALVEGMGQRAPPPERPAGEDRNCGQR
jgi:hypothetical protein